MNEQHLLVSTTLSVKNKPMERQITLYAHEFERKQYSIELP